MKFFLRYILLIFIILIMIRFFRFILILSIKFWFIIIPLLVIVYFILKSRRFKVIKDNDLDPDKEIKVYPEPTIEDEEEDKK